MKNISLAVFALIYSSQVAQSNAILETFFSNWGQSRQYGDDEKEQLQEGSIVIEQGDEDIGEIIFKPYHKNEYESIGEDAEVELSPEQLKIFQNDPEYQEEMQRVQNG